MTTDLDRRARDAAAAARASVGGLAGAVIDPPVRRVGLRRLVVAGCALVLVAVVAFSGLGDDVTTVATGPAGPGPSIGVGNPGSPPPMPDLGITGGLGAELVSGTASGGRAWALYVSTRDNALCLAVDLGRPDVGGGVCEGGPFGAPTDPYRPLFHQDTRTRHFVAGRVPAGVTEVTVMLTNATQMDRRPVIPAQGGPYYVVEIPSGSPPAAVIGHRADGTSVRYPY